MALPGKVKLPSDSYPGPLQEARVASTAGGGTAISTNFAIIGVPNNTDHVSLIANSPASSALVLKLALNPFLLIMTTANFGLSMADFSIAGQQNPGTASSIVLNGLTPLVSGGALYIGSHIPIRGMIVAMSANVNSNASVLSGSFWNGSGWVALSGFTDGTASGGATFAQNGTITWTVPTTDKPVDFQKAVNPATVGPLPNPPIGILPYSDRARFWYQLQVSATLSAATQANSFFSLNRDTTHYSEYLFNTTLQFRVNKGVDGVGCVEALTNTGTGNLIVNCYTDDPTSRF